ncbi:MULTISPECIES: ead/Ea22-like family protein [Klebsiella/Raoultella group]|uniref:ead/Ea22-like family protein n=1 Tax=Klebsiella/Raoultella group TaxID=2890311 RepID=UPI0007CC845C|nr:MULTISPECIES: ead/Ea22-like family protein [Klebsiella/Raoultella group]SBM32083.1 Ead domain protein [Klebsiella oxytoca]HBW4837878.1 hypothetical protein [Klebsiella pneumoniae]HBW5972279.1 hypothetical protein [Klebsiella pneumoniae]
MTIDITELVQSLKAAITEATPGPWYVHDKPCEDGNYGIDTSDKEFLAEAVVWWGFARQSIWREEDAKYIALANPANILALVEALEKAHAENTAGVAGIAESYETTISMLKSRIAELESRTVTVKLASRRLPSDYVDGEFGNDDLAAIHNACRLECKISVEKYLSAHGIVVKWEDE